MTENLEKQVAELGAKIDTVSANCADTVKEAYSLASQLKDTNQTLEAAMKDKEEEMKKMKAAKDDMEEETKKMKAAFEAELEVLAKKMQEDKAVMEDAVKKTKSELDAANEVIAAMKMKEEEMAKKEKKMKRMASLVEQGVDTEIAANVVDKFDSMEDEAFESMTSLFAGKMPPWLDKTKKKEEEAVMKKKTASTDDNVSALEEVEVENTVDLSVGSDETETHTETVRAELLEFVSARLGKNS